MSIKIKLLFISGFSALAIIVLGVFLFFFLHSYNLAIEKNNITDQITRNIFENNLLLSEYLFYYEDRPRDLWLNKNDSIVALVKFQSAKFLKASEKEIINNLLEAIGKNQKTFLELLAFREGSSKSGAEQQARLSVQILINNQEAVFSAGQLAVTSAQDADFAQKTIAYFLVGFVVLIFIIVAVIVYFIWRSIGEPLIALKEAAVRIATLDFTTTTTTTTTTGGGELGELGRVFNVMTGKLKESYASLKNANIATQNILEDLQVARDALAKAKAQDEAILFSIGDAVMACDKDGRIIIFNAAAEKVTGFLVKEAIGRHYNQVLKFVRESDEKPGNDFIAETITTGKEKKMENHTLLVVKDGRKIPVADSVAPIKNSQGEIIGGVVVFRDATKEREIDKAKTEFVSIASHQLRTPLTTISWYTEMILKGDVGKVIPEQKKYLEEIYQGDQRMIELVNTVFSHIRMSPKGEF